MTDKHTRVRRIEPRDTSRVCELVRDLADYERARPEALMTDEQLDAALFGDQPSLFGHVAEIDGVVVGFAVWFLNFSTWRGRHGIYLEDLYVCPEQRGSGLGRELLAALADECVTQGYGRLEWAVLDWNTPSIEFYRLLGARSMDEWTTFRLDGEALIRLAASARSFS